MAIINSLVQIFKKIFSNLFYQILASVILSVLSSQIVVQSDLINQIFVKILRIIEVENIIIINFIIIIFLSFLFFIVIRIIYINSKKPFYFKYHGGVSWYIDKRTGIVNDELYCPRHHLRLHSLGLNEYYCQKNRNEFWRISEHNKRQLYKEVSNLAEKKFRNRIIK